MALPAPGRLAILELKTTEDLDLPLQAADYWSRIRRHQEAGDLARYGYFPGVQLQPTPPLVYLIAPALRFHPSTDAPLEFLRPELEGHPHRTGRELALRPRRDDVPITQRAVHKYSPCS